MNSTSCKQVMQKQAFRIRRMQEDENSLKSTEGLLGILGQPDGGRGGPWQSFWQRDLGESFCLGGNAFGSPAVVRRCMKL